MKKCLVCGKGSLLLYFSSTCLCGSCEKEYRSRTAWAFGEIQEELKAADKCTTVKGKAKHLDAVGETLDRFVFYQDRGMKVDRIVIGGRPLEKWKMFLEEKKHDAVEQDAEKIERLKICPHCHGVQSKPVKRERACELCGERIVLHNGEPCTPEKHEQRRQQEEAAREEAIRQREILYQKKVAAMRDERFRWQVEEVRSMIKDGERKAQILAARDQRTCPNCLKADGKIVSLVGANVYIPAQHCTSEYCRCTFVAVIGD